MTDYVVATVALIALTWWGVWWSRQMSRAAADHRRNAIPGAERECSVVGCHRQPGHSGRHD